MNQDVLARTFFFAVFLILLAFLAQILRPFFEPITWAIVLAVVFSPFNEFLFKKLGGRKNVAASLSLMVALILIVAPFILFAVSLVSETIRLYPLAEKILQGMVHPQGQPLSSYLPASLEGPAARVSELLRSISLNPHQLLVQLFQTFTNSLPSVGSRLAVKSLVFLFKLFVMAVTLFFILRDGKDIAAWIKGKIPMNKTHQDAVTDRLSVMVIAVVRGILLTAVIQGVLGWIGYWAAGVSYPVLLGFATTILAIVPFGSAVWVWLPVVIYLWAIHRVTAAVLLFLWSMIMVSTFDNFLRPWFIGSHTKLPFLMLFFGVLGGVVVYGPLGIVVGPIIIAASLAFVQIFETQYFNRGESR